MVLTFLNARERMKRRIIFHDMKLHETQISASINKVLLGHSHGHFCIYGSTYIIIVILNIIYFYIFNFTNKTVVENFLCCYINTYIISSILPQSTKPKTFTLYRKSFQPPSLDLDFLWDLKALVERALD